MGLQGSTEQTSGFPSASNNISVSGLWLTGGTELTSHVPTIEQGTTDEEPSTIQAITTRSEQSTFSWHFELQRQGDRFVPYEVWQVLVGIVFIGIAFVVLVCCLYFILGEKKQKKKPVKNHRQVKVVPYTQEVDAPEVVADHNTYSIHEQDVMDYNNMYTQKVEDYKDEHVHEVENSQNSETADESELEDSESDTTSEAQDDTTGDTTGGTTGDTTDDVTASSPAPVDH